nr:MAG TPA: hypothetical protein [Caudoviricetes sp.]
MGDEQVLSGGSPRGRHRRHHAARSGRRGARAGRVPLEDGFQGVDKARHLHPQNPVLAATGPAPGAAPVPQVSDNQRCGRSSRCRAGGGTPTPAPPSCEGPRPATRWRGPAAGQSKWR